MTNTDLLALLDRAQSLIDTNDEDLEALGVPPLPDLDDEAAVADWTDEVTALASEHKERSEMHLDRAFELLRALPFEAC